MLTAHHGILPGVNYPDSERGFKAASLSAFLQQSSSTLFSIALALALALGLALALLWLFWSFGLTPALDLGLTLARGHSILVLAL